MMMFLKQYVFCVTGAALRYGVDNFFRKRDKRKTFRSYLDYEDKPETEFVNAVLGTIIFVALITLAVIMIEG